ncbi:MAG: selenide, water dikinase SelD [Veillonellales bacterium]
MIKLTEYTKSGGCAAKIGPGYLAGMLQQLPLQPDSRLLVGLETSDDAGVYQLDETTALIQTVDFFTPIVDDPYLFGQIAATNSLSDVYAMGGKPVTAMNIVAFPVCKLDTAVLLEILRGGLKKIKEAGAVLVGGHSIQDNEPKYGLSVTGIVHPRKILTNAGAKPGDALILTKALGTGVLTMAARAEMFPQGVAAAIRSMTRLNKSAAEVMGDFTIHACTDVTGFGLLGHLSEIVTASRVTAKINSRTLPILPEAKDAAAMGFVPAGAYNTRGFLEHIVFASDVAGSMEDLCYDPQTSGGLLMSVPAAESERLLADLQKAGIQEAAVIGEIVEKRSENIYVD